MLLTTLTTIGFTQYHQHHHLISSYIWRFSAPRGDIFRGKINFLTKLLVQHGPDQVCSCELHCNGKCKLSKFLFLANQMNTSWWNLARWEMLDVIRVNNTEDNLSPHQHCFPGSHRVPIRVKYAGRGTWVWQQWCVDVSVTGDQDTPQGGESIPTATLICTFHSNVRVFC